MVCAVSYFLILLRFPQWQSRCQDQQTSQASTFNLVPCSLGQNQSYQSMILPQPPQLQPTKFRIVSTQAPAGLFKKRTSLRNKANYNFILKLTLNLQYFTFLPPTVLQPSVIQMECIPLNKISFKVPIWSPAPSPLAVSIVHNRAKCLL